MVNGKWKRGVTRGIGKAPRSAWLGLPGRAPVAPLGFGAWHRGPRVNFGWVTELDLGISRTFQCISSRISGITLRKWAPNSVLTEALDPYRNFGAISKRIVEFGHRMRESCPFSCWKKNNFLLSALPGTGIVFSYWNQRHRQRPAPPVAPEW